MINHPGSNCALSNCAWNRIVKRLLVILLAVACWQPATAQDLDSWQGTWITDKGVLIISGKDSKIRGTFGEDGVISGKVQKGKLAVTYKHSRYEGKIEMTMSDDGRSFETTWDRQNGDIQTWRGWRKDSAAETADMADFSGYWMTSWGPMQIEQDGNEVNGTYAAHGWSSFEGTVTGRRMNFQWKKLHWSGEAWLEMSIDGKRIFGATKADAPSTWTGIRIEDHEHHVEPKAGQTVKGYADNGMMYHLRMPDDWKEGDDVDLVVLLHGSNWTTAGMVFVTNENWPEKIGKKFAILGIQGERWVKYSDADSPRFNYTYVNWMGRSTYEGFPYTDRESPYLVMNVIEELQDRHEFDRIFVGGHSQGGYLTYLLHMHFPKKLAGTFPMAGGLIIQAEPSAFDDKDLIEAQKSTPMAIVHGTRDRVVPFATGGYNYNQYLAHNFTNTILLSPELGHGYDFLPVDQAIEYLDAMSSDNMEQIQEYGERMVKEKNWRVVAALIQRSKLAGSTIQIDSLVTAFEEAADKDANRLRQRVQSNRNNKWVDSYLKWEENFRGSDAGERLVMAYDSLRDKHQEDADQLMSDARKAFNQGNRQRGMQLYQQIADEYYASSHYRTVKGVLDR